MLKKSLVIAVLGTAAAAGTLSTTASAQGDPVLGALIGGGIGAAIGHSVNGRNGAWVGGAVGALTGASIAANSGGYYAWRPILRSGARLRRARAGLLWPGGQLLSASAGLLRAAGGLSSASGLLRATLCRTLPRTGRGGYGYYGAHPAPYAYQGH